MKITFSVTWPDLDRMEVDIPCPFCRLGTEVNLGEIRRHEIAICRGCHANIRLEDHMGQVHKLVRMFNHILDDWR